jgi:hypothetical protein
MPGRDIFFRQSLVTGDLYIPRHHDNYSLGRRPARASSAI